jgi:hypothetical protein
MDIAEISRAIEHVGGLTNIGSVATFRGRRKSAGGRTREITVMIHDEGVMAPLGTRYTVVAKQGGGVEVHSPPSGTIESALQTLRWSNLDHTTQHRGFQITQWG